MTHRFVPGAGLIVVPTLLEGPQGTAILRFALDTGATRTVINGALLTALGYWRRNEQR